MIVSKCYDKKDDLFLLKFFILEPFDKYGKTPEEGLWEFSVKPIGNYFKFYGELLTMQLKIGASGCVHTK